MTKNKNNKNNNNKNKEKTKNQKRDIFSTKIYIIHTHHLYNRTAIVTTTKNASTYLYIQGSIKSN
jgi:hypothetical protein